MTIIKSIQITEKEVTENIQIARSITGAYSDKLNIVVCADGIFLTIGKTQIKISRSLLLDMAKQADSAFGQ